MNLHFVSILFRHLTVSQLSALRAVACGWRNRINRFFGLELFSLELTHELAGIVLRIPIFMGMISSI